MLLSYLGGVIKAWSHLDIRRLLVGFWLHASNEHLLTDYYFPTSKKQGVRREAAEESENQSVLRLASSLNTPKELVLGYDYLTPFEKLHFILQIIFSFPFMLAAVLLEVCKHIPLLKHIFKYIIPAPQVVLVIVSRMIVSLSLWLIKKCSTILFEGRWLFLLIMPVVVSAPDWLPLLGITDLLPYLGLSGLSGEIIYYGVTIFIGLSIGLLCLYESEIRSALARHPDVPRVLKIYPVDTRIQQTQALANGRNTKHLAEARTESHEFERGKDKDVSIRESEYLNASGTAALVGKPTFKVRHIDGIRSPYYKMVGDDKDASDDLYYLPHNNGALVLERHKEVYTREKSEFRNGNLVLVPGDKGVPIQHPSWSDRSKATVRFDSEHGQYHLKFSDGSSDIWVDTARDVHVQLQEKGFKNVGSVAICPSVTLESGHYHVECPDSNDPVAEIFAFGDLRGAKQHLRRRGEDTRRLALLEPDIYSATFYARGTELKLSNRKLNAHHSRVSQFMPVPQKAPNVTNGQLGNSASSHTHRSDFTVADPDRKRNDSDSQGTTSTRKPVTADSASLLSIKINMALENVMQKDERWLRWLKEVSDEAQLLATGDMSRLEPILLKVLDEQMPNKVIEMEKRQGLRSTCENIRLKIKGHIEAKQFDTAILLLIKCPKKVARVLSSQLLPILDTCQNLATRVDTFFSQSHKENSALKTFLEQSRKVIEASIRYMSAPVKTETEAEQGVIHLDFDDAEQLRFDTPQQHFFNSLAYTQKYLITILKQVEELWKSVFDDHADAEKFGDIRQLIGEKQFDVALQEIEKNFAEIDKFIREQKSIILEAKAEIDALPFFLKKDLGQQAPSLVEAIEEMKSVELGLTLPSQSRVKKIKTGLLALLNDVESESKNTLEEFILKGSFAIAVQGIVRCYGENLRDQLSRKLQTKLEDGTFPHTGSGIEPGELEEAKASSKSVFNFDEAIKNIPNAIIQKNADLIWTLIKSRAYVSAQLLLDLSPLNNHFSQHSLKLVLRKLEAVDHIDDEKMYLIIHDIQQCHLVESLIPEILNAISNRVPLAQIENLKFERMMQVDHNSLPEALKKRYLATKAAWQNYVGLIQRSKNGTALSHASPILHLIEIDELLSSVAPDAKKDKPDVLLSPVNARGSVDDVWLWKLTQTLGTSYEWALMFLLDEERYGCIKLLMTLLKEHDHQNIALFMRLICTEDKTLEVAEIFARMGDMKAAVNALQCYSVDRVVSGGLIQPIKALSSSSDRDSKEDEDWALDDLPRDILKSIAVAERLIIGYQAFSQTGQDLASLEQSAEELRAYLNRKYEKTLKYIRWLLGPESKDSFSSGERATRILNSLVALDKIATPY
ncbi:MAG: hypothetical protein K0Q74_1287 [Gammaproteobacteria bacterium]|nr:hypothetical protein [Gammaproteobacteria bacterium]